MTDTTPTNPVIPTGSPDSAVFGHRHLTRLMIVVVTVVFCMAFGYASNLVGWPIERRVAGSLAQPPAVGAFVTAIVTLVVCAAIGTMLLGRRFFLAGLMTATAGLTVWATRGGTMEYVLFNAQNSGLNGGVFFRLLGELVILFGVIGAIWSLIWSGSSQAAEIARRTRGGRESLGEVTSDMTKRMVIVGLFGIFGRIWLRSQAPQDRPTDNEEGSRSTAYALIVQAVLMTIFVMIFVATQQKKQVLTGVFLAGLFSTAIAENFFADHNASRWYWVGPLAAGALGYITGFMNPAGMETGDLSGIFAPLARALPLDYASLGCAGALMGYWWMMPEDDGTSEDETEPGLRDAAAAAPAKPEAT